MGEVRCLCTPLYGWRMELYIYLLMSIWTLLVCQRQVSTSAVVDKSLTGPHKKRKKILGTLYLTITIHLLWTQKTPKWAGENVSLWSYAQVFMMECPHGAPAVPSTPWWFTSEFLIRPRPDAHIPLRYLWGSATFLGLWQVTRKWKCLEEKLTNTGSFLFC